MAVYIVKRTTKAGEARFLVRWQKGRYGRDAKQVHCGSFKTLVEARTRKRWAELEVAAGRAPGVRRLFVEAAGAPSLAGAAEAWLRTRVDVTASSRAAYRDRIALLGELGVLRVDTLTTADVQHWVLDADRRGLAPNTIRNTIFLIRSVLDHAGLDPNPARARGLRLPLRKRTVVRLPTRAELAAVYAVLPPRHAGLILLLEHTGLRVSEAVALAWIDVDEARQRFLVAQAKTPTGRRFVSWAPSWCEWAPPVAAFEAAPPADVGATAPRAPIPRGVSVYPTTIPAVQGALAYACKRAGVKPFGPHALRHLHASRLLHHGLLSPAEIAARLGHASPSLTLSTYSWTLPPD